MYLGYSDSIPNRPSIVFNVRWPAASSWRRTQVGAAIIQEGFLPVACASLPLTLEMRGPERVPQSKNSTANQKIQCLANQPWEINSQMASLRGRVNWRLIGLNTYYQPEGSTCKSINRPSNDYCLLILDGDWKWKAVEICLFHKHENEIFLF